MTRSPDLSRRAVLCGVSAAALYPGMASAQQFGPSLPEFAAKCRELSGFDPIPRELLEGVQEIFSDEDRGALISGDADASLQKRILKSLYTGMHRPEDGEPNRFAYSSALMYAAIEDAINVPSYCGGLPGYWADPPAGI